MAYSTKLLILIFSIYALTDLTIKIRYTKKNIYFKKSNQRNKILPK